MENTKTAKAVNNNAAGIALALLGVLALAGHEINEDKNILPPPPPPPDDGGGDSIDPLPPPPAQATPGYHKVQTIMLDPLPITDANPHYVAKMLNLSNARNWGFIVDNQLNQAVTIALIGGDTDTPADSGLVGQSATIAAKTKVPVIVTLWMPFMGLLITPASTPSTGAIGVVGWTQEPGITA
jgi:hypothetical protein